jgi:RNA polymerase sigma-70 factor (ECF subfamily)
MTNDLSLDLVERWRGGDEQAADELFRRYMDQLVGLARSRMTSRLSRRIDPEDVVQSAFRSFFVASRAGRFELRQGGDIWRLLVAITLNKLHDQVKRNSSGKRDSKRETALDSLTDLLLTHGPTPLDAMTLAEEVETLMRGLGKLDRQVIELRLQGDTRAAIAEKTGRSVRTVTRILDRVKKHLEDRHSANRNP